MPRPPRFSFFCLLFWHCTERLSNFMVLFCTEHQRIAKSEAPWSRHWHLRMAIPNVLPKRLTAEAELFLCLAMMPSHHPLPITRPLCTHIFPAESTLARGSLVSNPLAMKLLALQGQWLAALSMCRNGYREVQPEAMSPLSVSSCFIFSLHPCCLVPQRWSSPPSLNDPTLNPKQGPDSKPWLDKLNLHLIQTLCRILRLDKDPWISTTFWTLTWHLTVNLWWLPNLILGLSPKHLCLTISPKSLLKLNPNLG